MIYFIQEGTQGPIKIGYTSRCPVKRMSYIQSSNPRKLRLVGVINNATEVTEKSLHDMFENENIRGEWFHASTVLIDYINKNSSQHIPYKPKRREGELREWLKSNNITQGAFAKRIGRTQGRVSQIIKSGTDSLTEGFAIERETSGEVKAESVMTGETEVSA